MGERVDSSVPLGSIDKSRVLDVKPIRYLVPIFPNSAMSAASGAQPRPFMCVPPSGPFPPGVQPFYPFLVQNDSQPPTFPAQDPHGHSGVDGNIPAPVPLNSFRTPSPHPNGAPGRRRGRPKRRSEVHDRMPVASQASEINEYSESHEADPSYVSGVDNHVAYMEDGGSSGKRSVRSRRSGAVVAGNTPVEKMVHDILTAYKLAEFDDFRRFNGDSDTVGIILFVYDLIRRKLSQLEESKGAAPGAGKRPDMKATNILMTSGVRTNVTKRIGHVPGVVIGDIFFFRMEMCLVGLHAPSMAGIDYMTLKTSGEEYPVAVSVVSSGGYDDEGEDCNVLVYSGQGGKKDGKMSDQKLERGNLALEKSVHHGHGVRVIRGIKDAANAASKVYVYDGLYTIQESWSEKKSGCNVFKYKLVRMPGQQEAFSIWKSVQQWKDGTAVRDGVILPDLTSGSENLPVALVNEVDREKGPAHFIYIRSLRYGVPFALSKQFSGCKCLSGCQPGDANCACNQKNDGCLPYSPLGILLSDRASIHECGLACSCPPTCRNRMSQSGVKFRLEVFKTRDRGWGLRSWDHIRAGSFICEYAGDIIKSSEMDDQYVFDTTRFFQSADSSAGAKKAPFPLIISARNHGNVARFMNHSCSPNVFWVPVLRESGYESYMHVAFFAIRHIPPLQELTYDYGVPASDKPQQHGRKRCACGSGKCRGYFF